MVDDVLYRDFSLGFEKHPITGDIAVKNDENSVNQSIKNLVMTAHWERPFHSEIGSNLRKLIFEPATVFTAILLKEAIKEVILNFEPRVALINVVVSDHSDNNTFRIKIIYAMLSTGTNHELDLLIKRSR